MTMIEIEAKIRLADPEALQARLEALNAPVDQRILETNTYYDLPDGRLKSTDQGLRIRTERDQDREELRTILTHKGPRAHGQFKSRTETELVVGDRHDAADMLTVLGYHRVLTFEKRRVRYLLDDCRVEIDTLPYLGTFVEIEGPSEDAVNSVREKLGLADQPLIRASYIAMLATHLQEQRISQTSIRLKPETSPQPA
jgi:adenylate cyclase class 2